MRIVEADLRTVAGVGSITAEDAGQQSVFQRQQAEDRFDDPCRTERVPGSALGRTRM